jgi:hypothetical protein
MIWVLAYLAPNTDVVRKLVKIPLNVPSFGVLSLK